MSRQAKIVFTRWWLGVLAPDLILSPKVEEEGIRKVSARDRGEDPPIGQLPLLL
jgi:hypothetical protein